MKKNLKLLHLANHIHHNLFQDILLIGGFYNWHRVFHYQNNFICWDIHTAQKIREDKPDVILLGLSRPEMMAMLPDDINRALQTGQAPILDPMVSQRTQWGDKWVHQSDGRTKDLPKRLNDIKVLEQVMESRPLKVFHIDYAVQMWKQVDMFAPGFMRHVLEQADFLFTADVAQGHAMNAILGGTKDIYFIPHPTNVNAIKHLTRENKTKSNIIRTVVHRYDNEWYMPYIAGMPMREIGEGYKNILVLLAGDPQFGTHIKSLGADMIEFGCRHSEWIQKVADTYAGLDSYHWFTNYGRSAVEWAACNTPLVGSDCTYLQKVLFPELTVGRGCVDEQGELLLKLIHDKKFYEKVQRYAFNKVDDYGYEPAAKRFMDMIEGNVEPRWKAGYYDKYRKIAIENSKIILDKVPESTYLENTQSENVNSQVESVLPKPRHKKSGKKRKKR